MSQEAATNRQYSRWILPAIILLFIITSAMYIWQVPHFEGPDERQHFAYIEWLAEGKGFPPQGDAAFDTEVEQEAGQSPLYYILASLGARLVGVDQPGIEYAENPHAFSMPWPRTGPDNDNRATHKPGDGQPLSGGWLALFLARLLSMTFGILLLVSVYLLAREIFPDTPQIAWASALIVAVTPQVVFISSVASNDIPVAALSALTLWLLAVLVRRGPTFWRALGLGVAFGLASLTKTSSMGLALPIGVALVWLWLSGRQSFKEIIKIGVVIACGTLAVVGWWFIRSWILYQSPLGLATHDQTPWAIGKPEGKLLSPFERWQDVFRSYWISLGWGTIRPNIWIYRLLTAISLLGVVGLIVKGVRWLRQSQKQLSTKAVLLTLLFLTIVAVGITLEIWMRRVVASYGRLMFPAAAAITILLVVGWYTLHPKLPLIIGGLVAILALTAPFWLIRPAYLLPTPFHIEDLNDRQPFIGWLYGPSADEPIAELLSVTPLDQVVMATEAISFDVCWRVLARSDKPYSILVHVIGPDNALITNRRSYPGLGTYPTTIWEPGEIICDNFRLIVWSNLAETLVYNVEIAMLDAELEERLPIFDNAGNEITAAFTAKAHLIALDPTGSTVVKNGNSEEALQLLEYEVSDNWKVGQSNDFTVRWAANASVDQDYQLYVHLRDQVTNETVAQADGPPLDGWYPTSWWLINRSVIDDRSFYVPDDVMPGNYDLYVGFYDLETGVRFGEDRYLGSIEVQQ